MARLTLDNGIEDVEIYNLDGSKLLTTLHINKNNEQMPQAYAKLIDNLSVMGTNADIEEKEITSRYEGKTDDDSNIKRIVDLSKCHIKWIEKCIDAIDEVFGEGTIRGVFSENYELDEDFVPDIYSILEFIDKITPLMQEMFNQRFEQIQKKYNANRKHSKGIPYKK